ncbi:hypothetical protein [Microbacterium sp.]|uniref:hypothetical protein n=1 Tax=Microbacterium sp. TaxID=51671 RepID=UPI0039E3D38C
MKGKIGLVVGLGAGYVLGTRAGRERYEQIKTQWLKVWHLDPVQDQVAKVRGYVGEKAAAVPGVVWNGVVKIARSATAPGTPGQRLDATLETGEDAAEEVVKAVSEAKAASSKPAAAKKPSASKTKSGS